MECLKINFFMLFSLLLLEQNLHINCLELPTIVVSLRTWGKCMTGKRILFFFVIMRLRFKIQIRDPQEMHLCKIV